MGVFIGRPRDTGRLVFGYSAIFDILTETQKDFIIASVHLQCRRFTPPVLQRFVAAAFNGVGQMSGGPHMVVPSSDSDPVTRC